MYTYKITWTEFSKSLGLVVEKSFRTTDDAIKRHTKNICNNPKTLSWKVEKV